jgi:hypothetical protein
VRSDERQALEDKATELAETMLKLHERRRTLTADSLRLAATDGCSTRNTPEPLAATRYP